MTLDESLELFLSWFPPDFFNRVGCRANDLSYVDSRRGRIRFHLFTDVNEYVFTLIPPCGQVETGSISCSVRSRKPRAGEDWRRGRDLPSGPFDKPTLVNLLLAVLATECVKVHKPVLFLYDSRKGQGRGQTITSAVDEKGESVE